jgi:hypothetical protein
MLKKSTLISAIRLAAVVTLFLLAPSTGYAQPSVKIEPTENSRRQAGLWQQVQTLTIFEIPRAQPAIAKAAKNSLGRPVVSPPECVTSVATRADSLVSRLAIITPQGSNFMWARLSLQDTNLRASGFDGQRSIDVEGKITPILTDIQVSTTTSDPVFGQVRRVQRTQITRLGSC